MADWSVAGDSPAAVSAPGWWAAVPAVEAISQTGWWEATRQLLVPAIPAATAALHPPTVTAGVRLVATPLAATAGMPAPGLLVTVHAPAMSATAAMPVPQVRGGAVVSAVPMTATAVMPAPTYVKRFSGSGGFPYTFDFELDSDGFAPDTFDYTFDFALG